MALLQLDDQNIAIVNEDKAAELLSAFKWLWIGSSPTYGFQKVVLSEMRPTALQHITVELQIAFDEKL